MWLGIIWPGFHQRPGRQFLERRQQRSTGLTPSRPTAASPPLRGGEYLISPLKRGRRRRRRRGGQLGKSIWLGLLLLCSACAPKDPQPDKLTIAVIPKGTSHVFWQSVH